MPEPSALAMPLPAPMASAPPAPADAPTQPSQAAATPPPTAPVYPEEPVVVASPDGMHSQSEVARIEAELLGLAERQSSAVGTVKPRSIVDELKSVGQRHSSDTLKAIEAAPAR